MITTQEINWNHHAPDGICPACAQSGEILMITKTDIRYECRNPDCFTQYDEPHHPVGHTTWWGHRPTLQIETKRNWFQTIRTFFVGEKTQ